MRKLLLFVALIAMGLGSATAASGVNWDDYDWLGNGSGNPAYTDKIKVQKIDQISIVNLQLPGFASEAGIYITTNSGISNCNISSDIQGAGIILHLSAFFYKETLVEITNANDGTFSFWVYYENGAEEPTGPVAVEGISIPETATVVEGKSIKLEPVFTPLRPTNKNVTWNSDNESVATVDAGVVSGVAPGTATITVTTEDGNFEAHCTVTVTEAPKVTAAPYDIDEDAEIIPIYIDNNNAIGLDINPLWGQATKMEEVVIDGNKTLKMSNTNYQGITFTAFSFEGTKYLHFEIYPEDCTSIRFTPIIWDMEANSAHNPEQPRDVSNLTPNEWNSVNIPMAGFTPYEYMIGQLKFHEGNNNTFYVDNICFIKGDTETDPGTTPELPEIGDEEGTLTDSDWVRADDGYAPNAEYSMATNADGTITFSIKFGEEHTGLVPQINVQGEKFYDLTKDGDSWKWTSNKEYKEGDVVNYSVYAAHSGGVSESKPLSYIVKEVQSSVESIIVAEGTPVYYNLQGVRVENNLTPGIYIKRQGTKTSKVIVK